LSETEKLDPTLDKLIDVLLESPEIRKRIQEKLGIIISYEKQQFYKYWVPRFLKGLRPLEHIVKEIFYDFEKELGFKICYPSGRLDYDCECETQEGKIVKVEFEAMGSGFVSHKHDPKQVDYLVCWLDNRQQANKRKGPKNVIELAKALPKLLEKKFNSHSA